MRRKYLKTQFVMYTVVGMLAVPFTCNAADNPDGEYVMHYDLETKETTYYGYNYDTHEFYEIGEPADFQQTSVISDGTADIADIDVDADVEKWAKPGTIYIDREPVKEDPDNPYAILFSDDGMPTVYQYNAEQETPWSLVDEYNLLSFEGIITQVGESSLVFTDNANRELTIDINEDEAWQIGDRINVVGLLEEDATGARLTKQFGYFKIEAED